jgi:hypothetical protein
VCWVESAGSGSELGKGGVGFCGAGEFTSLDITNMYSNIPCNETKQILKNLLSSNMTDHVMSSEILNRLDVITKQNYFTHRDKTFTQTDGLVMGTPSSGIISEIFLQHFEHSNLPILDLKHKLVNYFRYIDDVLLIYDNRHTDIHTILTDFNSFHHNLQFIKETEHDNKLNYLDLTIHKTLNNVNISIFRKPTFTNTSITFTSNHPPQHKYAAIPVQQTEFLPVTGNQREDNTIHNILHNNSFPLSPRKPRTQPKRQPPPPRCSNQT